MKKFTKLFLTFALLFGVMGGVNSVKAEKVKLYSKGFTETVGGSCSYDGETHKFSWSAQYSNAVTVIKFTAGLLPYFSTVKLHVDDISEGGEFRIIVKFDTDTQYWQSLSSTGDISINISDFQRWGTKINAEEIATAFEIRLSGSDGESHVGDWVQIDPTSIYLETSWDAPMSIASASDWAGFSKFVSSGVTNLNAVMTDDINVTDGTMVGTDADGKRYQGIFNGAGHELTFTYEGDAQFVAPFSCIDGATITDLWTKGSITTSNNMPSGIVGKNVGNSTLTRCASSMTLSSTDSGNGRIGGLVGRCADGNQMTFNYCMYDGAISSAKSGYACGFVGWDNQAEKITLNNCLVASTSITGGGQNFINNTPIIPDGKYAYFLNKFGSSTQGTKLEGQLLYSGQAAYNLNNSIEAGAWFFGQGNLNSSRVEECPSLTSDASKKVYKASNEALYANSDGLLPDPALSGKLAWKMAMTWDPIYFVTLPAASASSFELYGSADAFILNVSSAGATTLVVPFAVAEENIPSGVKVYDLTFDGTAITATRVNSITANKPVLINAPEGEYRLESGISYDTEIDFSSFGTLTNDALTGVYNTTLPYSYVPADAYVLQNGAEGLGFYKVDNANEIKITSFRAYLTADTDARSLSIVFADETNGINDATRMSEENAVYNLQGVRVAQPTKGLYIVNGKKMMVK